MLIRQVQETGLVPAAVTFHIGSQATNADAWARTLGDVLDLLRTMADNVRIPLVDIGGGFPHRYVKPVPSIAEIAAHVQQVLRGAPYPVQLVLEPGRALAAGCATLYSSVIARVTRNDQQWLFLDAGVYHGLSEAALPGRPLRFPVRLASRPPRTSDVEHFTLTGPTCDSLDVIDRDVLLPGCVRTGDRLAIESAGAYSMSLSTSFNGFPPPPIFVQEIL
jgi:ornithine decarboxylase